MLNRVLIYFKNEANVENLLEYGKLLEEKYGTEIVGLYVKDIRKYELAPVSLEGMMVDSSSTYLIEEWEKIESDKILKIKEKFNVEFSKSEFKVMEGIGPDIVLDKLRGFDLLLAGKNKKIDQDLKSLLKSHLKPMILISGKTKKELNNVLFANDLENEANKSFFDFIDRFKKVEKYEILTLNIEEEDEELKKYLNKTNFKYDFINKIGNEIEIIKEESDGQDLLIIGNIKHFFMFEKLRGKLGIKILEEIKIPIYIA